MFKKKLLVGLLMAAGTVFASVRVGIVIGAPPPPRVVRVRPPVPGPGYTWVAGYWIPVRGHYRWHSGYWARAPLCRRLLGSPALRTRTVLRWLLGQTPSSRSAPIVAIGASTLRRRFDSHNASAV
jgi:hypothetical protein